MFILVICYVIFLVAFAIFSAAGIYHLWRFGYVGDLTKPAIIIYLLLVGIVIAATIVAMSFRSWPMTIG